MMRGFERLAQAVAREGIDLFFGLLANSNLALVSDLVSQGARFVSSRHEAGAVSLAMGHAWARQRPAFVTVGHGPALSNALTALTTAARDRVPLVLLVGDITRERAWSAQRAHHREMVAWTGAHWRGCPDTADLDAAVGDAFDLAGGDHRPVVLSVPTSVLVTESQPRHGPGPVRRQPLPPVTPADDEVRAAALLLASARRPVVLAGRGALWAGAGPMLERLANRSGALLTTTLPAKGLFGDHPRYVGVCGGYASRTGRELLEHADCVAVFGAGLNGHTTDDGSLFRDCTVIHCDVDRDVPGRHRGADVAIHADAALAAAGLVALLPDGADGRRGWDMETERERLRAARDASGYEPVTPAGGVDPRLLLSRLDTLLPADRQVVVDLGHFSIFPSQVLDVPTGGCFLPTVGFGSVGLALPTAIGAALGRPLRTVAVVGDGGLLMSLSELETLRRSGADVTVVLLNDKAYGAEIHHLRRLGLSEATAEIPEFDFAAVARAAGVAARRVDRMEDLQGLGDELSRPGPFLLDVRVSRETVSDRFVNRSAPSGSG
jgi:thiamine pyrophosphate-dependent acetolactate synthase large subunit-like protein